MFMKLSMEENKRSIEENKRSIEVQSQVVPILNELIWLCKHCVKKSNYIIGHLKPDITLYKLSSPI